MAAKKHNFTATELKAGVLVLVSAVLLCGFIAVIDGMRVPKPHKHFYTFLPDTKGLNKGAAVRFGGAKVGTVNSIRVSKRNQSLIRIDFSVDADVPVNEKSTAFVTAVSLTAEKHLEVSTGTKEAKLMADGSEIPSRPGDIFDQAGLIASKVVALLKKVDRLMGINEEPPKTAENAGAKIKIQAPSPSTEKTPPGPTGKTQKKNTALSGKKPPSAQPGAGEQLVTVAQITHDVDGAVKEGHGLVTDVRDVIAQNRDDIKTILTKVEGIENSAKKMADQLNGLLAKNRGKITDAVGSARDILARVNKLSAKLDDVRASLQATLDHTKSLSADAQNMLEQNRPAIEDMILDLRETVRNLKSFSATIARQPQAVIRGKTLHGRD